MSCLKSCFKVILRHKILAIFRLYCKIISTLSQSHCQANWQSLWKCHQNFVSCFLRNSDLEFTINARWWYSEFVPFYRNESAMHVFSRFFCDVIIFNKAVIKLINDTIRSSTKDQYLHRIISHIIKSSNLPKNDSNRRIKTNGGARPF